MKISSSEFKEKLFLSTLDMIKDLCIDSKERVIFNQLQSGTFFLDGVDPYFISNNYTQAKNGRTIALFEEQNQLVVLLDPQKFESFDGNRFYCKSNFVNLEIEKSCGAIVHLVPATNLTRSKLFFLTDIGYISHIAEDGGVAQINVSQNSKFSIF